MSLASEYDIFSSLKNAIISYDIDVIETAIKILHTNSIPSSDTKVLELLTMDLNWFKEVYSNYRRKKDDAILWNAVGLYGFRAYINHSLLGSFLEYAKVFLEKGIL